MWHILEKWNRRVARKVTKEQAEYLERKLGGEIKKDHTPRDYTGFLGTELEGEIIGYVSNEKPIFSYAQIEIVADGVVICSVTRKPDAFRIMNALKRDYKNVIVRLK